jgi:hypothetical protein
MAKRIAVSPFGCRWIEPGTEPRLGDERYAICKRAPEPPRVVAESECARCVRWQPPLPPLDEAPPRER